MKKFLFVFLASILLMCGAENSYGQENITPIRTDVTGFDTWTDVDIEGTSYLKLLLETSSTATPAMDFDSYSIETLNFKARTYGGTDIAENTITVSISTDNGGAWTVLGTRLPVTNSLTAMAEFDLSTYDGTEVMIKFTVEGTSTGVGAGIDDISIEGLLPASPTLNVDPSILSGLNYIVGSGPSAEQSCTVSGTTLDNSDVIITPSTNYEISLTSGTGFQSTPITLAAFDGTDTPVYVRLIEALPVADYNSEVTTIAGGGASDITVTCNGTVNDVPSPTLVVAPASLTGLDYLFEAGPSAEQTFTLSGIVLDGSDVIITPSTSFEISLTSGTGFQSTPITLAAFDGTDTEIFVRLITGLAIADYNSEDIAISGGSASDVTVTCSGSVIDGSTLPCYAEDFSGFTTGTHESPSTTDLSSDLDTYTMIPGWTGLKIYSAAGEIKLGTGSIAGYIISPTIDISAGATLNFDYEKWGTDVSVIQVFHASDGVTFVQIGTDITPGDDFQSFSIDILDGTALSKIKIGTDVKRCYLDNIEVYCGAIAPTPTLIADPTSLSGLNYIISAGPSVEQLFTLSGTTLDNSDVIITPSTNYEISLTSGTGFQSTPITITAFDGTDTPVYVRLIEGLAIGDYNSEIITIAGGGASDITVTCNGTVSDIPSPTLIVDPTSLTGLDYLFEAGPSAEQSFNLSGIVLDNSDVIITPSTNFEISLTSGTGFQSTPITITTFDGTETPVYVRLIADLAIGDYNSEDITISGGSASDVTVTCNGSVIDGSATPCLAEDFSGFTTGTHESPSTTDLSADLDTYTVTSGWTGLKIYSAAGEIKLGTGSIAGYIISPTIDLSDGSTLNFDYAQWGTDVSVIQVFHASDGVNFVQIGTDITPGVDFQTFSIGIFDGTALSKIKIGTDVKRCYLDNIEVFCSGAIPIPVLSANPTSLSGFTYIEGYGPSEEQSFEISGTNLDASNVIITPSTNYEISLTSGTGFQSTPITIAAFDGTDTPVYVRLIAGLAFADYNSEIITIAGGGATDITVTCNGIVDEYVSVNQYNSENEINIYPNPVSTTININITNWDSNVINWEIINITGQNILEGIIYPENSESFMELDLDFIRPGIYYFRFTADNKTITKKIYKQ